MDKNSIPLDFYLNDGGIDKTGYQQLKIKSFAKAVNVFPSDNVVSIGPEAVHYSKFDSYSYSGIKDCCKSIKSTQESNSESINYEMNRQYPKYYKINESPDRREERLCRKKILAEFENMCFLESKEKINQMRREWMERDKLQNSLIEAEVESNKIVWEQKRQKELNTIHNQISQLQKADQVNAAFIKKISEDEETIRTKELQLEIEMKNLETKRMLKELDIIHKHQLEYSKQYREAAKLITEINDNKFQNSISAEKTVMKGCNDEFLKLIEKCKANDIDSECTKHSQKFLSLMKKVYGSIFTKYEYFKKEIENENKKKAQQELELKLRAAEEKKKIELKKIQEEDENKKILEPDVADTENQRLKATLDHYLTFISSWVKAKESLKDFINDTSLKKFRSECQKAVNVPVNAISPTSASHMKDKLKKLTSILSGQQIMVNGKLFIPNQHPLGVQYCTYFLATKIVKQGEDVVSSQPDAAFAIASVALAIWDEFPNFGNLLIAAFYEACPYLIPIYWDKEENMTDKEYYKKLGFRYVEEERDEINTFLKKQGGIARLYFTLIITHVKSDSKCTHPFGLWEAWRWIAMFTSLGPQAEISATILFTMLEMCGFALMKTYGKQFKKLLHLICVHYVPEVQKVTPPGSGGPVTRLKSFLENMISNASSLQPPKGLLPTNFW